MKQAGGWHLPDADRYFGPLLEKDPRGFQIDLLEAALKHVREWRTAVDGGAHVGTWSALLGRRFNEVLAFEPALDTFHCLARNVRNLAGVTPLHAALGVSKVLAAMRDDDARPGNTGARYIGAGGDVCVYCLDDFGIAHLDFLKLDLEGYEYFALLGAAATVRRCRPVMVIEDKDFGGRFGLERGGAGKLVESWGAKLAQRIGNDCIYTFEE